MYYLNESARIGFSIALSNEADEVVVYVTTSNKKQVLVHQNPSFEEEYKTILGTSKQVKELTTELVKYAADNGMDEVIIRTDADYYTGANKAYWAEAGFKTVPEYTPTNLTIRLAEYTG